MALLNLTAASRAAGVNRSTVARAVKSGKLSTTTNEQGERCIDTAELMRAFGPLEADARADAHHLHRHAQGDAQAQSMLVEVLQEQLRQATEREREGREREARLLALLESESAARRDLEQKLLLPPQPDLPPRRHHRLWLLLAILALAVAALVWTRTSAYWPLGG